MVVLKTTCFGGAFSGNGYANRAALKAVQQHFMLLGFPEWYWLVDVSRFYSGDDILIDVESATNDYQWIWIGAHNQSALRDAAQKFPFTGNFLN